MLVNIIRGQNQIGGNIIEVSTASTRILLDVGLELDVDEQVMPEIDGLFDNATFDAVMISHYHGDHLGLAYFIDKRIPIYMGEASTKIVQAADSYKRVDTIAVTGYLQHKKPITIGDITVTPYLCDHSAFDSYMLLCESEGERVLYTGDFRANGRKSFDRLLHDLPDKVDKLICEGTTLSRKPSIPLTEANLEEEAVVLFKETNGPIFVMQSATNIDRIVTMYRAAKRSGRVFLEELYMADVASSAGTNIPNPAFSDVFAFITNPSRYEGLTKYHNRIGKKAIAEQKFVMCIRSSMLRYLESLSTLTDFGDGLLIYSMWEGYKSNPETAAFLNACEKMGLKIISLHTSGHADPATIGRFIQRVNPAEIIPIHTTTPEWFEKMGSDA